MELNTAVDLVEDAQTLLFYIEAGASGKSVSSNVVEYVKMDAPKLELEEETASKSKVNLKWTSSTSSNKQVEYTLMCVKDQTTQPSSVPQNLKVTADLKTVADNLEAGHIHSFYVEATLKEKGCVTVKEAVRSNNVEYNFVKPVEEGVSAPALEAGVEEVPEEDIPTSRFPAKKKVSDIFDDPFKAEEVEEAPKPKRKSLKEKQAEAAKLKAEEDAAKLEAKKIKEGAAEKAKLLAEKKKKDAEEAKRLEEEKKKAQEKKAEEARRAREEAEKQEEEETEEESSVAPTEKPVDNPVEAPEKPTLQPVADIFGEAPLEETEKPTL